MGNEKNIEPYQIKPGQLSSEEASRRGSKGGKQSVKSRRRKKLLKEIIEKFLNLDAPDVAVAKLHEHFPQYVGKKTRTRDAIVFSLMAKCLKGDLRAFEVLRDTIGENPVNKQEIGGPEGQPIQFTNVPIDQDEAKKAADKMRAAMDEQ